MITDFVLSVPICVHLSPFSFVVVRPAQGELRYW
jgi:hypothetical protein